MICRKPQHFTEQLQNQSRMRDAPPITGLRALSLQSELSLENKQPETTIALSRELRRRLEASHLDTYLTTWISRSEYLEGSALLLCGRGRDAVLRLESSVRGFSLLLDSDSPVLGAAEARLGEAYLAAGDRLKAEAMRKRAGTRLTRHPTLSPRFLASLNTLSKELRPARREAFDR